MKVQQQDPASLSLEDAAFAGHLDILVKVEKWDDKMFTKCVRMALLGAHMHVLEWFSLMPEFERLKCEDWTRSASHHRCLLTLRWLHNKGCPMHIDVVDNVAHDAAMLDTVLSWGLPTTDWTWKCATEGTLECLEVLAKHEVPFPSNGWAIAIARERKQVDKLLWLLKHDAPMYSDVLTDFSQSREVLYEIVRRSATMGPPVTGNKYLDEHYMKQFVHWKDDLYKAAGIRVTAM